MLPAMRLLWAFLTFGALGCSSPTTATTPADTGTPAQEATVTCTGDPRADTYVANLERLGTGKAMKFVLVQGDPAPPSRGNNTWTLKIADASSKPITDATIEIKPFMPDHGHGSSVKPSATKNTDGSYKIDPLYFFMPGLWQVTFNATSGATSDTAVFTFCVAG